MKKRERMPPNMAVTTEPVNIKRLAHSVAVMFFVGLMNSSSVFLRFCLMKTCPIIDMNMAIPKRTPPYIWRVFPSDIERSPRGPMDVNI